MGRSYKTYKDLAEKDYYESYFIELFFKLLK